MNRPGPARIYATAGGALLVLFGLTGMLYSVDFGRPGVPDEALGLFAVNGWANLLHLATGLAGLACAGRASRAFAAGCGLLYLVIGVWSLLLGGGGAILSLLPTGAGAAIAATAFGLAGIAAAFAPLAGAGPERPEGRAQMRDRTSSARPRSPELR